MNCQIQLSDILTVYNTDAPQQHLSLDISRFYCRLFETTRDQCRDYLEEIMKWTEGQLDNYDALSDNLLHITAARRRYYGYKR